MVWPPQTLTCRPASAHLRCRRPGPAGDRSCRPAGLGHLGCPSSAPLALVRGGARGARASPPRLPGLTGVPMGPARSDIALPGCRNGTVISQAEAYRSARTAMVPGTSSPPRAPWARSASTRRSRPDGPLGAGDHRVLLASAAAEEREPLLAVARGHHLDPFPRSRQMPAWRVLRGGSVARRRSVQARPCSPWPRPPRQPGRPRPAPAAAGADRRRSRSRPAPASRPPAPAGPTV